jgi:periplasmic copper chaperone A
MRLAMIAALGLALSLGACNEKPKQLGAGEGWVRLTVQGGPADDRLVLVTADFAVRSEIHESMKSGGMMSMKPMTDGVAVPAGSTVAFKPGGLHVMLFDIRPDLAPPGPMPLNLRFASGTTITISAKVESASGK